jgi:hypothetical protein
VCEVLEEFWNVRECLECVCMGGCQGLATGVCGVVYENGEVYTRVRGKKVRVRRHWRVVFIVAAAQ